MTSPTSTPQAAKPGDPQPNKPNWISFALVALLTAALTGSAFLFLNRPQPAPIQIHPPPVIETDSEMVESSASVTPSPPEPYLVHVSGAVSQPGVYELEPESRVFHALEAAGGFTEDAYVDAINQAEPVLDGQQVHVPSLDDEVEAPNVGVSGGGRLTGVEGGIDRIELNSATLAELDSLPGIGPAKAQAIVDGRPYASVDELVKVDGIAEKTVEQLRELVDVR